MTIASGDIATISLAAELSTGIMVKTTVVLALAGLFALVCRSQSAAFRCALWSTALIVLIVLPIVSLAIPSWQITQLKVADSTSSVSKTMAGAVAASPEKSPFTSPAGSPTSSPASPVSPGVTGNPKTSQVTPLAAGIRHAAMAFIAAWLVGVVIVLARVGVHARRVRKITLRASPVDDSEIEGIAGGAMSALGIRRPFRLVCSDETSVPFSWGVWRPVVVLPDSAPYWPADRKRSVLLHELAHIARWDYVLHILVQVVCALNWPNPAVWYAAHRSALERERACDDYALRQGTPSEVYASELLQIARSQVVGLNPVPAVTMAGKADLLERIHGVMNKQTNRKPFPQGGLLLTAWMATVLTLPLAAIDFLGSEVLARHADEVPTTRELIRDLTQDDDPLVRRRAAWWLGEHEDYRAVEPLIEEGLRDRAADVRLVSAWALGEIKDEDAIDPLIDALDDRDPLVREMAALALGEIEDPVAIDALVDAFDQDEDLGGAVIWALGEIGGREASQARKAAFRRLGERPWDNDEVWTGRLKTGRLKIDRFTFYRKAGKRPDCTEEIGELLHDLRSRDDHERRDAAFGIGALGIACCPESATAVDALLETLRDPVPEVRAMAVWALDEINPSRW